MYGYRQDNGLVTNLNSISSSLSSIDTVGRRNNAKASADNLIGMRNQSVASTGLLWRASKEDRYSTTASVRNGGRYQGSEIYYSGGKTITSCCPDSESLLNFLLVPLLLLTITRQVIDFLGQTWLQILINFLTIIIIIVALFGIKQRRVLYLNLFTLWALFNTVWNLIVICVHTRIRDVGINEDALSFYTGATSWWHSNGPGCLPYNISSIQPTISILQQNIVTGCRLDYHLIEAAQAAVHASLSFLASLVCCCLISNIRRDPAYKTKGQFKEDKIYRLNNLTNDRTKVNQDPFPNRSNSRLGNNTTSLRRAPNKTSSRSSQHSVSSMRSARRRARQSIDGTLPTPRGSTSSIQRSQKYGSLSSRRSQKRERRGEVASLTYGTTGDRAGSQRTRVSSLSSADYLPSYQPPHSSNANLLSSYGEISSIDSYNNQINNRSSKNRRSSKVSSRGNTNPTYIGSRSSICSQNNNANNYDDLSYIYGNNNTRKPNSIYGVATNCVDSRNRQSIYQQGRANSISKRNGFNGTRESQRQQATPQEIVAETHQYDQTDGGHGMKGDTITKAKLPMINGSFHSFSSNNNQQNMKQLSTANTTEINNNHMTSKYQDNYQTGSPSNGDGFLLNGQNPTDSRSRPLINGQASTMTTVNTSAHPSQLYSNQRNLRQTIYSNQMTNGNSETPI